MGWTYRIFGLVCTIHLNLVSLKSPIPVVYKKKENTEGVFWLFSGSCTIVPSFSVIRIFLFLAISLYDYYRLLYAIKDMQTALSNIDDYLFSHVCHF